MKKEQSKIKKVYIDIPNLKENAKKSSKYKINHSIPENKISVIKEKKTTRNEQKEAKTINIKQKKLEYPIWIS